MSKSIYLHSRYSDSSKVYDFIKEYEQEYEIFQINEVSHNNSIYTSVWMRLRELPLKEAPKPEGPQI